MPVLYMSDSFFTNYIIDHMNEILSQLNALYAAFAEDAQKNLAGNKAAGVRARKASLEIEKLCKEFRKASLAK